MSEWLCIDVGFTNTRIAVRRQGSFGPVMQVRTLNAWADRRLTANQRRDRWLAWLGEELQPVLASQPGIARIGLCLPGPVGSDGVIAEANSLWGEADDPLTPGQLAERLGRPVAVLNDLVATSICHGSDPGMAGAQTVLVLSVGSGIGMKLYDCETGRVVLGREGLNGEIGFSVVDETPDAEQTIDGSLRGTLGLYASGSGFARMLRRAAVAQPQAFGRSQLAGNLRRDALDIAVADRVDINAAAIEAIGSQDDFSLQILQRSIDYLARSLHIVILFAAPDRLALAGGFATSIGETYRAMLCAALAPRLRPLYSAQRVDALVGLSRYEGMDNLIGLARFMDQGPPAVGGAARG
ncbi:MAG: ROK family protein [Sphingopyxis sp.]|uniref:ROK family protein n=1 Tax=Sphingopyxis sp. TaxID=1908224 RepID=UPI003D811EE9